MKNAERPPAPDRYPAGDAGEVLRVFDDAARPVLSDRTVWREEEARHDAEPLPWPPDLRGRGYDQFVRYLVAFTVDTILGAIHDADGPEQVPPQDPQLPAFQMVLRVAKRATEAGVEALQARFGGTGRMSLKRDLMNFQKLLEAERAVRSGGPRNEAFRQSGLSRAGAYRALKRKR